MKSIYKFLSSLCSIAIAGFMLSSCEKSDSSISYGIAKIFIPQAINLSAGVNNDYPVPSGTDSSTYNYKIDLASKKVNIILGVALSGEDSPGGYTVDINTNADTVNQIITAGSLGASAMLMPASIYSLPSQIAVPTGGRGATFYLAVDRDQLKANYANKKLVLAVKLAKPTAFPLNESISTVIVILDVKALNL